MFKAYKGLGGYKEADEHHQETHIILTTEEYKEILSEFNSIKVKVNQANKESNEYKEKTKREIQEIHQDFYNQKNNLIKSIKSYQLEIKRLNSLNSNLLRIAKERANAERKLIPKKKHSGYIILNSIQYTYNFKFENRKKTYIVPKPCWKIEVQSFYNSSIPFRVVRPEIESSFLDFIEKKEIKCLDIWDFTEDGINELWNQESNFLFNINYKQNFKSGFWELQCLIRYSI